MFSKLKAIKFKFESQEKKRFWEKKREIYINRERKWEIYDKKWDKLLQCLTLNS